jgi:colicin import membrane protein
MTARSPSAFALSALLHTSVAVVVLLGIYYAQQQQPVKPVVFELVAGGGNNYAATEAPALGSPDGQLKVAIPKPMAMPAMESPANIEPEPVVAESVPTTAPQPVVTEATHSKVAQPRTPDFTKSMKRIEARKIKKAVAQIKAEREAEAKRLSKEEFDRLHKQSTERLASMHSAGIPRIDAQGIASGVISGSTANKTGGAGGKALTREEQSLLDSYYEMLKQRLHDALEKPPGLSDRLITKVQVRIQADGTLTDAQILQSSGSDEFDHAALAAVAAVGSIGPKPDGRSDVLTFSFRMLDEDN